MNFKILYACIILIMRCMIIFAGDADSFDQEQLFNSLLMENGKVYFSLRGNFINTDCVDFLKRKMNSKSLKESIFANIYYLWKTNPEMPKEIETFLLSIENEKDISVIPQEPNFSYRLVDHYFRHGDKLMKYMKENKRTTNADKLTQEERDQFLTPKLGIDASFLLVELLLKYDHHSVVTRRNLVRAICNMNNSEAIKFILTLIDDDREHDLWETIYASIEDLKSPNKVPFIIKYYNKIKSTNNWYIKISLAESLIHEDAEKDPDVAVVLKGVILDLNDLLHKDKVRINNIDLFISEVCGLFMSTKNKEDAEALAEILVKSVSNNQEEQEILNETFSEIVNGSLSKNATDSSKEVARKILKINR